MSTQIDRLGGAKGSLAYKAPVRVATTANITLSGTQTIDGIAVVSEDRVLVKDQDTGSENGIYIAKTTAWVRAKDMDGSGDVVRGTRVDVQYGSLGPGTYVLTTADTITIGTSTLTFSKQGFITGPASATANHFATFTDTSGSVLGDSTIATTDVIQTSDVGSTSGSANAVQAYTAATTDVLVATDIGSTSSLNGVQKYVGSTSTVLTTSAIGNTVQGYVGSTSTILTTSLINSTGTNGIQSYDADTLKSDVASTLTAGFSETPYSIGTSTGGEVTISATLGNIQYVTNNASSAGTINISTPSLAGRYVVEVINSTDPGAITSTGYGSYVSGTPSTEVSAVNIAVIYGLSSVSYLDWKTT